MKKIFISFLVVFSLCAFNFKNEVEDLKGFFYVVSLEIDNDLDNDVERQPEVYLYYSKTLNLSFLPLKFCPSYKNYIIDERLYLLRSLSSQAHDKHIISQVQMYFGTDSLGYKKAMDSKSSIGISYKENVSQKVKELSGNKISIFWGSLKGINIESKKVRNCSGELIDFKQYVYFGSSSDSIAYLYSIVR